MAESYVYFNNLAPIPVSLSVSFPGNVIENGEWALEQTSLQPFDVAGRQVAWVSRNVGIKDDVTYTMLINVNDTAGDLIVSANLTLAGTFAGSDIAIGAQNSEFTDTGHTADGQYADAWTDSSGQTWIIEFTYLGPNPSLYDDVMYTLMMSVPGQQGWSA